MPEIYPRYTGSFTKTNSHFHIYVWSVGVRGEKVSFKEGEIYSILKTDQARLLWSDCEELQIIVNLYQVKIKAIKTDGDNDLHPVVLWIVPAEEIKKSKLIPEGQVPDMQTCKKYGTWEPSSRIFLE